MTEIQNAKIVHTSLGVEDHGIFTCYLTLEGDGWGCSFGGYALDTWDETKRERVGTAIGFNAIIKLMETLDVKNWEELKGKMVRVETDGWGSRITKIGHIIKNRWFSFEEFFRKSESGENNV